MLEERELLSWCSIPVPSYDFGKRKRSSPKCVSRCHTHFPTRGGKETPLLPPPYGKVCLTSHCYALRFMCNSYTEYTGFKGQSRTTLARSTPITGATGSLADGDSHPLQALNTLTRSTPSFPRQGWEGQIVGRKSSLTVSARVNREGVSPPPQWNIAAVKFSRYIYLNTHEIPLWVFLRCWELIIGLHY